MSLRTMGQAAVTMNQLQHQMDTIGNNMANSSTPGYKSKQAEFSSLLFQHMQNVAAPESGRNRLTPEGLRIGTGARIGGIHPNMAIGSIQTTERDLDVALANEDQFFQVMVEENGVEDVRFTRDGSFHLQPVGDGEEVVLVTSDGNPVVGTNGPIRFSSNEVTGMQITSEGNVLVDRDGQIEQVGQLEIVGIDRVRLLEADGENLYRLPDLANLGLNAADIVNLVPSYAGMMESGALEMSNVDIGDQMTQLINAQRSYQFNARTISTADQMQGLINQMR